MPEQRTGYALAALAAVISGIAVYLNSLGVRAVEDPVLYTALKDGLVGTLLLIPLAISSSQRAAYSGLNRRRLALLVALALTGGSLPFALFFSGLQITTAATGALINHSQFLLVAIFAATLLKERIRPAMVAGMAVLLLGGLAGTNLHLLQWNFGAALVAASTVLFAIDFVIAKQLLRELPALMVMTARMTLGTAMLFVYLGISGRLEPATHLEVRQWEFILMTGLVLLLFTVTTFTAIRHASVSAVMAIGTGAPIVTAVVQMAAGGGAGPSTADLAGLGVLLAGVVFVIWIGLRQEARLVSAHSV